MVIVVKKIQLVTRLEKLKLVPAYYAATVGLIIHVYN